MLIAGYDIDVIEYVNKFLKIEFDKKDIGPIKEILGISIISNMSKK